MTRRYQPINVPRSRPRTVMDWIVVALIGIVGAVAILALVGWILLSAAHARDNGQYAQVDPGLKEWVESLKDADGVGCCATADGTPLEEPNWKMTSAGYRVQLNGHWYNVPDRAVITKPNKLGHAVVWFYWQNEGAERTPYIRCFLPGAGG